MVKRDSQKDRSVRRRQPAAKQTVAKLHPRNRHQGRYDFDQLIKLSPDLAQFVTENRYDSLSIDFHNPDAVKALNQALLKQYYRIQNWDIPAGYLCPPIPGRADYIHCLADLMATDNGERIPQGKNIRVLDIGTGANCIYPIIGSQEYGWSFAGSELDPVACKAAKVIIAANTSLKSAVECRLQPVANDIFRNIIAEDELFDLTLCNPPFHKGAEQAAQGTQRKLKNLKGISGGGSENRLNFGGRHHELWCEGGESAFIQRMVKQSQAFGQQCYWFSSLVSNKDHLPVIYRALQQNGAERVETVNMAQGQKQSRFVAWTFLTKNQRQKWRRRRWSDS